MTTIIEGTQYALTSPMENKNSNHSVVFVKLTDSALKAIEDYTMAISKGNVSNSVKPLIQLRPNNSQGIITIPNNNKITKDNNNDEKQSYNFSVKDIQNDGILECVKQTNSNMSMESLGRIMLRMQIHANDDSYQKTKVKMAVVAEQELKKYNTKVINSNDQFGRKVKRPYSGTKFGSTGTGTSTSLTSGSSASGTGSSSTSNGNINNSNNNSQSSNTNTASNSSTSTFFNKQSSNLSRFNKYSNNSNSNNVNSQTVKNAYAGNFHSNSTVANSQSTTTSTDISKKVREILMQLLATKSHKLVDIITKVQERIKEPLDKSVIVAILNSMAIFKEGTYHLNETTPINEEVQLNDLKEDREINQKRNGTNNLLIQSSLQELTASCSNINGTVANTTTATTVNVKFNANNNNSNCPNGNSISPFSDTSVRSISSPNSLNASPNAQKSANSPYAKNGHGSSNVKRSQDFSHASNNAKKFKSDTNSRLQIPKSSSHGNANSSNNGSAIATYSPLGHDTLDIRSTQNNNNNTATNNLYKSSSNALFLNDNFNGNKKISDKDVVGSSGNNQSHQQQQNKTYAANGNGSGSMSSSPNSSPDSGISHIGNILGSDSGYNHDSDDYLNKYSKIQDTNQLIQYKHDFNAEFPEYKKLYEYVENVSRQFEELKELIQAKEEESDEWHELIKKIFEKYDEVKNRSKYQKIQKRLIYLHYKLLHIKNLINEYLMNHPGSANNGTEKSISNSSKCNSQVKS